MEVEQWLQEHVPQLHTELLADDPASRYVTIIVENERHLLAVTPRIRRRTPCCTSTTRGLPGCSAAAEVTVTLPVPQVGLATDRTAERRDSLSPDRASIARRRTAGCARAGPGVVGPIAQLRNRPPDLAHQQRDPVAVLAMRTRWTCSMPSGDGTMR